MGLKLSVTQRLALGFMILTVMVLVASGVGVWYSLDAARAVEAADQGLLQAQQLSDLNLSWLAVVSTIDHMMATRQTGLVKERVAGELEAIQQQLAALQAQAAGTSPDNVHGVESLQSLEAELGQTVDELVAAAREGNWALAQILQHTELETLGQRWDAALTSVQTSIQAGVELAVAHSVDSQHQLRIYLLATVGIAILAAVVTSLITTRSIVRPVNELAARAERIMQGDLQPITPLARADEIGALSRTLAHMTDWLRESVQALEQQVDERTRALAQRTRYMELTSSIAREAATLLDLNQLFSRVVVLISQQFDFYHAGILMVEPGGEWVTLQAASSPGGQRMVARGHRLRVGSPDLAGQVTKHGEIRVLADVRQEPGYVVNLDLPLTRSQAVLPLRARGQIIGALDVHSRRLAAFDDDNLAVLQSLTDQVAVAISNAQLFQEAQTSLDAERRAYGQMTREAWRQLLLAQPNLGIVRDAQGFSDPVEAVPPGDAAAGSLTVPIEVRGVTIGSLDVCKPGDAGPWTSEQVGLLQALAGQLGDAIDDARGYQSAQRRAAREQLLGRVAARVRETLDMDLVLQTAAREVEQNLGLYDVTIRLASEEAAWTTPEPGTGT